MAWQSSYTQNADGTISFRPSWAKEHLGDSLDEQQYVLEYNNALKQYNDQYALQKEAFDFNKDLAERQQSLSEKSYKEGILNQANQLASLGINPGSSGQPLSSGTMSGGSNVSPGSVSGRNPNKLDNLSKKALQLEALSMIMQFAKTKNEMDVSKYNAETSRIQAETGVYTAKTGRMSAQSNIGYNRALTANINSQTAWQNFVNKRDSHGENMLETFGLNGYYIEKLQNIDWKVAVLLGLSGVVANAGTMFDEDMTEEEREARIDEMKAAIDSAVSVSDSLDGTAAQAAIDDFYDKYPKAKGIITTEKLKSMKDWSYDKTMDYLIENLA